MPAVGTNGELPNMNIYIQGLALLLNLCELLFSQYAS